LPYAEFSKLDGLAEMPDGPRYRSLTLREPAGPGQIARICTHHGRAITHQATAQ